MAKVIFEFDEDEDRHDIDVIVNRHKLLYALDELSNLRRNIYKGYEPNIIVVKDNKVVYKDNQKLEDYDIENTKLYIEDDTILNKLDNILQDVYSYLE